MPKYIQLPDGGLFPLKEGENPQDAMAEAERLHPEAFGITKKEPPKAGGSAAGDLFTALKQGAVGSTKALTDIFGADNFASAYLGQKGQELQQKYSPAAQEEMRQQAERMKAAEQSGSTWEEIKAAAQNIAEAPLRSTAQGVGSLVPYLPTMLLGPMAGALKLAPRTVAALEAVSETAPKVLGTAQGVGAVKGSIYDAVYQNELEATGDEQIAKNKAQAAQNYVGKNIDQMLVGGVLGRLAGGSGAERLLTKAGISEAAEKLGPRLLRAAGEEAITEGPQGAQERLAQNLALQREGVDVPTMQGVIGQGLQEGIIGALSAGPVAGLRGPNVAARRAEEERKAAEEAAAAAREAAIVQRTLPGFEEVEQPEVAPAAQEPVDFHRELRLVTQQLDDLREQAKNTPDLQQKIALADQAETLVTAQKELQDQISKLPESVDAQLKTLQRQMAIAEENGDLTKQKTIAQKMLELGAGAATEPEAQLEFPMSKFKTKTESVESFNQRVVGPEIGAAREAAEQNRIRIQDELTRLRNMGMNAANPEYARLTRQERQNQLEIQRIEQMANINQGVAEQGDLFGELGTQQYTGEAPTVQRTPAQIAADMTVARLAGNREAYSNLAEEMRAAREGATTETKGPAVQGLEGQLPMVPKSVGLQQAAADKRATGFANMVKIVSQFNRGLGRIEDLEAARKDVVDGLIEDAEASRGRPLEGFEREQLEREANGLLGDLVRRFGDTRNLTQKGTAKRPLLVPAQDAQGRFTTGEVPETGYPTVESAAPGYRTFGNPFAAAMSIKEGLDELRNKAVGTLQRPLFERQFTPESTTPAVLRGELDRAMAKGPSAYTEGQFNTLTQIADNLPVIQSSPDKEQRATIGQWLYRLNTGNLGAADPINRDVQDVLGRMAQAKLSDEGVQGEFPLTRQVGTAAGAETPTPARPLGQFSQFAAPSTGQERGKVFGSAMEFYKYLASDALQQLRSDLGLARPTLARLEQRIAPFMKRAEQLRADVDKYGQEYDRLRQLRQDQFNELQDMNAQEIKRENEQIMAAKQLVEESEAALKAVTDRLDAELTGFVTDYMEARSAFEFAVKTSEDITKAINDNVRSFNANVAKASADLAQAKDDLAGFMAFTRKNMAFSAEEMKDKFLAALRKEPTNTYLQSVIEERGLTGALFLQERVVQATRDMQRALALSNTEPRIQAFLQRDLDLQMQLAEEAAGMDRVTKNMLDAHMALELAKRQQDNSRKNKAEIKAATEQVSAAKEMLAEEQRKANERATLVDQMERALGFERVTIAHRISETQSNLVTSVRAASDTEAALQSTFQPLLEQARKLETGAAAALQAYKARRDRLIRAKEETQAEREERDRIERRLELEALDRLAAMPGERISFEKRRQVFDAVQATDEAILDLDDRITESQNTVDALTTASAKLDEQLKDVNSQIARLEKQTAPEPRTFKNKLLKNSRLVELEGLRSQRDQMLKKQEQVQKGLATIKNEIAKAESTMGALLVEHDEVTNLFSNEPEISKPLTEWYDKMIERTQNNIDKVQQRLAEKQPKALRTSRLNDLSKYKRQLAKYKTKRDARRGIERTTLPLEPLATEPVEAGDRLGARKIGPVVKATVQAGNVRTGEASTVEQRKLSPKNKIKQAGQPRTETPTQAVRTANKQAATLSAPTMMEAKKQLSFVSRRRDELKADYELAVEEGDTELATKLDAQYNAASKEYTRLKKIVEATPGAKTTLYTGEEATMTTSAQQDQLTPDAKEALADGRILDVLDDIAQNSPHAFVRENAAKVRQYVSRTRIGVSPDITVNGEAVPAAYSSTENAIGVRPTGMTEANVLHEATHAATMRVLEGPEDKLTKDQLAAKREINGIYTALTKNGTLSGEYAAKNVKEFVSEVQSNANLRNKLDSTKLFGSTALHRLYSAFMRLIGMAPGRVTADEVQKIIDRLYAQSTKLQAPTVAAGQAAPQSLQSLANDLLAKPKTFRERLGDNTKLEAEMQLVDMRAGLREALKSGDPELYKQAMYNVLKADQKMAMVYTTLNNGPLEMYTDDKGMHGVRSTGKDSAIPVFKAISELPISDKNAKVDMATAYLIAQRGLNKGADRLGVSEDRLRQIMRDVDANPELKKALEKVRSTYNAYNEGQIRFLASTGAIPKQVAEDLLASGDYVPFYRVRDDGTAELVYGDGITVAIGDIRSQPYLAELKGGEDKILPLNESLYRNTLLLTSKALTNLAVKSTAYGLQAIGKGKGPVDPKTGQPRNLMAIHKGAGPAGNDVIRFNQEPDPNDAEDDGRRWVKIETKGTVAEDVPAALVVRSMEGAHLPLPAFLKAAGAFSDLLRSGVTRMPPYIIKQLIRDPMSAAFTGGLNYGPLRAVAKASKEFVSQYTGSSQSAAKLIEKGLIQSNIFAGDESDISKMALQLASGNDQSVLDKVFSFMDKAAIRADASTRALVYENALKNGLSEVEADMMTMESMNFYKRGLNPMVQYGNRLIPFLNAQIQGLNVLFKAARGNMPFEEQQKIKAKFYRNAAFLFSMGLVYAMAMDDDEYFRNARPRDKYSNFFLHLPGVEEPIKIPTPFEAGYFFSVAVAAVDAMKAETNTKEQWEALRDMFLNSVPGWSSRGVPQIVKPVFEVWTNKNFLSGAPIESPRMEGKDITERVNANTAEFTKQLSKAVPILSPVQIEHIARGYLGQFPLALLGMTNAVFSPGTTGEAPEKRAHETAVFGSMFQKKYGGADTDYMFRMAKEAIEARNTVNDLRKQGRIDDAREYMAENKAKISLASAAGAYREASGRINTDIERTRSRKDLSGAEKTARIEQLEKAKQDLADKFSVRFNRVLGAS